MIDDDAISVEITEMFKGFEQFDIAEVFRQFSMSVFNITVPKIIVNGKKEKTESKRVDGNVPDTEEQKI